MRRSAILADHPPPSRPADTTYTSTRLTWQPAVQRDRVVRPDIAAYVVQQNGREILRLPAWATSVTMGALAPGLDLRVLRLQHRRIGRPHRRFANRSR